MAAEGFKQAQITNRSGKQLGQIENWFPRDLKAKKLILLPELSPGRSPLPTGCQIEVSERMQPDWRKFAVSDVGCGMQVLASTLSWSDFEANSHLWNDVYRLLKSNSERKGDLGSGNHFLDAAVDCDKEQIHFVIHTGSRHESHLPSNVVENPQKFGDAYKKAVTWARGNRDAVRVTVEKVYGSLDLILDQPHNFFVKEDEVVRINKGAVTLRPGELTVIPSSMEGDMAIVKGTNRLESVNFAVPHGTGRRKSRGEGKADVADYDFDALRKRLHIPAGISDASLAGEVALHYRDLDECLELIGDAVIVTKRLIPIAYMGQFRIVPKKDYQRDR